ncbi:MAG: late competence development ComFB family protein [Treponema sp.]|nr:late competence development ComFB family protein [Treponema sp.]
MVNIHNIMEEQVLSRVNELYEQVKNRENTWLDCDCENCRLDTVSYVLNRIPPRYVVSGRGITHNSNEVLNDNQLMADIDRLGLEGMRLVNSAKRPYHKSAKLNASGAWETKIPVFTFPTFLGTVYDGSSFEPLDGAVVTLKDEKGNIATMMDASWSNPCRTFSKTDGSYSFWVAPEASLQGKVSREFTFTISISCKGYTGTSYSFTLPLVSETEDPHKINSTYSLKIQDLFLFRTDVMNEQE